MDSRESDPELKDRVQRLLAFLSELVKARSAPVRVLDKHRATFPLDSGNIGVGLNTDAASGDVVLRARRVHLEDPPSPPTAISSWIRGDLADSSTEPRLAADAPHPEQFDIWLGTWRAWAAVDRERRPAWQLYTFLQHAMLDLDAQPESLELVVASGLLQLSEAVAGEPIRTHLITQGTVIERHEASGDLLVLLDSESGPALEDIQLLTGLDVFDSSGTRSLHESLAARVTSPVDPAARVFLKDWADRAITTRVDVVDRLDDAQSTDRLLTPSPALVLRKRGAYALVEYYDRMTTAAGESGTPVPLGLAQLVEAIEPHDRVSWLDRAGTSSALLVEDPLFPLPANQEQRDIIDRLAGDSGVVVEGPPGTGKTHTIANLVSALLARGQRVLVTSEKAQALRVLRDKLPAELQELCVSVTDAARGGSAELNRSVSEIATRKAQFDSKRSVARIGELERQRDDAMSRRASLTERIRQVRASETIDHTDIAPGYSGTAAAVVRTVTEHRARNEWLPEPILVAEPPLTVPEFQTLLSLTQRSGPERKARRRQAFPELALPPLADLDRACQAVGAGPGSGSEATPGLFRMLDGATPDVLERLRERCIILHRAVTGVDGLDPEFRNIVDDVLSGRIDYLWERTAQIRGLVTTAYDADQFLGTTTAVDTPAVGRHVLQAYDALAHALDGGEVWRSGLARFRRCKEQTAVEALGPIATVDGVEATTAQHARAVAEHLRAIDALQSVAHLLREIGVDLDTTGSRSRTVGSAVRAARSRDIIEALVLRTRDVVAVLQETSPDAPPIMSVEQARTVAASAQIIASARTAHANHEWLRGIAAHVRDVTSRGAPPEAATLAHALDRAEFAGIRAALDGWDSAYREYQEELHRDALHTRLADAAPTLAQKIADEPSAPEWPALLAHIDEAWAWRRADDWVRTHAQGLAGDHLERELDAADATIAQLTARLAAERAWHACLERTTAEQVQALQAYRSHIASIGKGTGKYAERFRAVARGAMQVAQGAVPAWVMPLQQVLSSIPAEQNSFDVVIVDEASQADIASLFLLWLAPRVIVVGDDKQCTPSDVTSGALDGVFTRLDSYLPDMPDYLRASFTPRSSMFSLLRSRFGSVIRLREHFRCMPEIINWSSGQFYTDAPLVPVRQFGADRLSPLRTTYVDGGVVTGKNASLANRVEATAIADAVQRCLADDAYDGKTFGVVVLQGQAQVDVITNELLDRLTPDQWEERRLRVGTPPDFQGDERHVVFMSMVVAPEQNIVALTRTEHQQRFNVAASRAQDQLWLFHSRTTDSLRPLDLRHSLLTYMQSTSPAAAEPMPDGVTRDEKHAAFDSLFEQRVYLDIVARGFHVNPQVDANGRRIDLVVTGATGKLAVECDGDHWHSSPEQQRGDLERERELQRCGWRFWRIRESEYYLDPVGSMTGLWDELRRRGIGPAVGGIADVAHADSVEWSPIDLVDDDTSIVEVDERELPTVQDASPTIVPEHVAAPEPDIVVEPPAAAANTAVLDADPTPSAAPAADLRAPSSGPNPLSTSIVEVLTDASLPVSRIAARVHEDWKVVQAELDRLIDDGRVRRVSESRKLAQYHLIDGPEVSDVVSPPIIVEADAVPISAEPVVEAPAHVPDAVALTAAILEVLADEPLPVGKLAERLGADWLNVHAELDRLVFDGRLQEITPFGKLTEYHLPDAPGERGADETPRAEEPAPPESPVPAPHVQMPVAGGWEALPESAIDMLPPSLASRIVEQLSAGPVALADLEFRLHEPRDRIEAVVEEMIAQRRVVWLPERGARVYGLADQRHEITRSEVSRAPTRAVSVSDLPPAQYDSVIVLLVAAAAVADLTVERAMKLSRLDTEEVVRILTELESEGRLTRRSAGPNIVWRRVGR
ncbi:MAG: AAA domain-containing protein [Rhodococcus sp. (in: high G+C Gram-positive bacteria)]